MKNKTNYKCVDIELIKTYRKGLKIDKNCPNLSLKDKMIILESNKAFEEIKNISTPLINSFVARFQTFNISKQELVYECNIGLITALNKYDPTKNTKFNTYLHNWLYHQTTRYIKQTKNTIVLPVATFDHSRKIKLYVNEYINTHHKQPTIEEILENTKLTLKQYENIKFIDNEFTVYNDSRENEELNYENLAYADKSHINKDLVKLLRLALETLTELERAIIIGYYGLFNTEPIKEHIMRQKLKLTSKELKELIDNILKKLDLDKLEGWNY